MGSQEVAGDTVGDMFKGYVFRISGGNDKQGFCMTQGILRHDRTRILMKKGFPGYRQRRVGERKRKSARGCIVDNALSVLNLVVVKKGENDLPGVTDSQAPCRLGPKRASKIRKLFALSKDDDVRKYVIRRELAAKEGKKPGSKAPKIQRLVTPVVLQRKRHRLSVKKARQTKAKKDAADYQKLLALRQKESREKRAEKISQRRSQRSSRAED